MNYAITGQKVLYFYHVDGKRIRTSSISIQLPAFVLRQSQVAELLRKDNAERIAKMLYVTSPEYQDYGKGLKKNVRYTEILVDAQSI